LAIGQLAIDNRQKSNKQFNNTTIQQSSAKNLILLAMQKKVLQAFPLEIKNV